MACYKPLKGWRSKTLSSNGKRAIVFKPREAFIDMPVMIPCGQCIGCRLERSRQWAIRCVHEASLHKQNCFITLTYNDENLPEDKSLHLEDFQKFFKRLRKKYGTGIRFFHCGEYGEKFSRPHYHCCVFGFDFPDKKIWKISHGNRLYVSASLNELWQNKGYCIIGDVTFESAAYVARYITKKVTGPNSKDYYGGRKPEYTTMSRRPGIAKKWFDKYHESIYESDSVVLKGKEMRPPKYYDSLLEVEYPTDHKRVKIDREIKAEKNLSNNTGKRLQVREKIQEIKMKRLIRGYENDD